LWEIAICVPQVVTILYVHKDGDGGVGDDDDDDDNNNNNNNNSSSCFNNSCTENSMFESIFRKPV